MAKSEKVKKKKIVPSKSVGMVIEKDSYIIVRQGTRHMLALAINPERNRAVIDASLIEEEPRHIEYDKETLVANLGKTPKLGGTAFGVRIEPFISSVESKYGEMLFYRTLNDLEKKALKRALRRTYESMREAHLNVFPFTSMKVFPKRGKYAGMYKFSRKMSEITDSVELFPETFEDAKYNEYLLYHEYGHAVWYKMTSAAYKARWIKMYHKRLELSNILKDRLEPMLDELLAFAGSLGDFYKELEEEDRLVFREVQQHYKRYHKMDKNALDILHTEDTEKFASMWPKRAILVEARPDMGEYAMTKPEEMFAEAFAFHMTGRQMPKDITKLMDKTLSALKSA